MLFTLGLILLSSTCQITSIERVSAFRSTFATRYTGGYQYYEQQKRQTRGILPFSLSSCSSTSCYASTSSSAFSTPTNTSDTSTSSSPSSSSSNFWIAKPQKSLPKESDIIPHDPNLDSDGPLPFGAYRTHGCSSISSDPKRNCLITVAVDVHPFSKNKEGMTTIPNTRTEKQVINENEAVQAMQSFIDAGFTSFQIAPPLDYSSITSSLSSKTEQTQLYSHLYEKHRIWSEKTIYKLLIQQTPRSVLDNCRLAVPIHVPPAYDEEDRYNSRPFGNGLMVRESICSSLVNMGVDSLDCVQVKYREESPYHLDVLNVLLDMQREGLIRSIEGLNIPSELLSSAESCGFLLDNNQIQCNLLDPSSYIGSMEKFCNKVEGRMKLLTSCPLAGGLLTDKYINSRLPPDGRPPYTLSPSQNRHVQTTLKSWAEYHEGGGTTPWRKFHNLVLGTLGDVSFKHRTSTAAVALRWNMQMNKHLGSVVVRSGLGLGKDGVQEDGRLYKRPQDLRKTFTFELDEEDMERLWNVAGKVESTADSMDDFFGGDSEGFSLPDLSNTKLWL